MSVEPTSYQGDQGNDDKHDHSWRWVKNWPREMFLEPDRLGIPSICTDCGMDGIQWYRFEASEEKK